MDRVGRRDGARCVAPADELDRETVAVLELLAEGHTTDRIARQLGLSERTVRRRLRAAADEFGAESTIQTVVRAVRSGLI